MSDFLDTIQKYDPGLVSEAKQKAQEEADKRAQPARKTGRGAADHTLRLTNWRGILLQTCIQKTAFALCDITMDYGMNLKKIDIGN